jgi:hypothetical protein
MSVQKADQFFEAPDVIERTETYSSFRRFEMSGRIVTPK